MKTKLEICHQPVPEYRAGADAYFDFFLRPLRVRVVEVVEPASGWQPGRGCLRVRLLEDCEFFGLGDEAEASADQVIPDGHLSTAGGQTRINTLYRWT